MFFVMAMVMIMMPVMVAACEPDTCKYKQGGKCFHDCLSLLVDEVAGMILLSVASDNPC